jgi:hypothetical protein
VQVDVAMEGKTLEEGAPGHLPAHWPHLQARPPEALLASGSATDEAALAAAWADASLRVTVGMEQLGACMNVSSM